MPQNRLLVAIMFADILLVPQALGADLWFVTGEGPRLSTINSQSDFDALKPATDIHDTLAPIYETLRILTTELPDDTTLIGFAGAPFTLASYAIEGGGSKNYSKVKALMYSEPAAWKRLMSKLVTFL